MSDLTAYERETIINCNQGDQTASIYTHDPKLIRQLDELAQNRQGITTVRRGEQAAEHNLPKKWIKVRPPKVITEETRAKMAADARVRFGHGKKEDSE